VPTLTLHLLDISHPCVAAEAALLLKGLDYERVSLAPGLHQQVVAEHYGEGRVTVPGLLVDGEPVHGSNAIMRRLDELSPEPPLLTDPRVDEAAEWGDGLLQDLGRRLPWGALHFRPEAMGTLGGGPPLDPAGTDAAMGFARASWKHHGITAVRLAEDLRALPGLLDHVDALVADGVVGGGTANGADLQIGATLRVLELLGDLRPLLDDRPLARVAAHLPERPGGVPAGAFPAGWVPAR
jgi:glutathione S-transferase